MVEGAIPAAFISRSNSNAVSACGTKAESEKQMEEEKRKRARHKITKKERKQIENAQSAVTLQYYEFKNRCPNKHLTSSTQNLTRISQANFTS